MRFVLILLFLLAGPVFAACEGTNILTQMSPADVARLRQDAARQPFHQGNLWQATKAGQTITLVGTYHLADPRHDATLAALTPYLDRATALLVEAGPQEEAALLEQIARDPNLVVLRGDSLPALMPPAEWQALAAAAERRGVPGFMAAKFQPWYLTMVMAIPPCMIADQNIAKGLDHRLIAAAQDRNIPVRALEPATTIFQIFAGYSMADQIALLRSTLAMEDRAADYATTLADLYFAGEARLGWEVSREMSLQGRNVDPQQVIAEMDLMEQTLMVTRNRKWIPVIEAAAQSGPLMVAFGALHLPGQDGVLALLQQRGFVITPLPQP